MNPNKIRQGVRLILEGIGEDIDRPGLADTPDRVAGLYEKLFSGVGAQAEKQVKFYITDNLDEMIVLRDIPFHSMCEHHLLPFFGTVSVAYLPKDNRITGFSNLLSVVEMIARRPQLQERMVTEIADILMEQLKPQGVIVIMKAVHMCLAMQGQRKEGIQTVTSAMRGAMRREATRLEALNLLGESLR
jgi:GTP cyclohydrolase I